MKFSNVHIDRIDYELPPHIVSTAELEKRLEPFYKKVFFQVGQVEALTGITERRYWDNVHTMHEGAIKAGRKAIDSSNVNPEDIGMVIYGGVCRDQLEPATSCAVAHGLNIGSDAMVYDVSNACLGALTGVLQVASAIELGQIKAGLVVSCESSRQIIDLTIDRILKESSLTLFKNTIATLTGGSGAVAILLTDGSFSGDTHKLLGGHVKNASKYHKLCTWGPDTGIPASGLNVMSTDSIGVMTHGIELAVETYASFRKELNIEPSNIDKTICHQVGSAHQKKVLEALNLSPENDFTTFKYLGNIGTVSLPITAAIADECGFLKKGDTTAFMGIGSGLNCMMLGVEW